MVIKQIIKWVVTLITDWLSKALYLQKKEQLNKELENAKLNTKEARAESDRAVSDFKLRLEQYRKQQRNINLRRTIERVRKSSGDAASNDRVSRSPNRDTEKSD